MTISVHLRRDRQRHVCLAFQQVSGVDSSVDVIEYRRRATEGDRAEFPGLAKYSNIQLKWGMSDDRDLYDWHRQVIHGDIVRKNGSIVLLDRKGNEVKRWNFVRAWPSKYDPSDLKSDGKEIAIETLELAHEGLELA